MLAHEPTLSLREDTNSSSETTPSAAPHSSGLGTMFSSSFGRRSLSKALSSVVWAVILSFFLSLLTKSICRKLSANGTESGGMQRRLAASGGDDDNNEVDELQSILEECVDMEEERGVLQSVVVPPESSPLESALKKARLLSMLHEAASSFEQEKRLSEPSFTAPNLLFQQGSMASYTQSLSFPSGMESAGISVTSGGAEYVPPVIYGLPVTAASFVPQAIGNLMFVQLPHGVYQNVTFQGEAETAPTDGEQAASSATPSTMDIQTPRVSEGRQENLEEHAFFRLPIVDCSNLREFNLHSGRARPRSSSQVLSKVHALLTRPRLSAVEAEHLMETIERLVSYTCWGMGRRVTVGSYSHVLRQLGLYFIILDSVVSAIQILGPKMVPEKWWASFVASVPTDSHLPEPPKFFRIERGYTYQSIKRLRPALELLKTRVRPSVEEVVSLKRMLFCSEESLAYFKGKRWNAWRDDERNFWEDAEGTSSAASGESDESDAYDDGYEFFD